MVGSLGALDNEVESLFALQKARFVSSLGLLRVSANPPELCTLETLAPTHPGAEAEECSDA